MATTIRDVAEVAQVSAATVSRVLRGDSRNGFGVSEATRQRITEIAQKMDYQANAAAMAMASGRTGLIGVAMSEVTSSFLQAILGGIQNYVKQNDLAIVLYTEVEGDAERSEKKLLRAIRSRQVDGVLLTHYKPSKKLIKTLNEQEMPFVTLSPQATPGRAAVHVDDEEGGRLAARHLINLGHQHIAVAGPAFNYSESRWRGADQAISEVGGTAINALWPSTEWQGLDKLQQAQQLMCEELLTRHPQVTGIISSEDFYAVSVYRAARKLGRRVPEDLSVIGYDNMYWTEYLEPPLTTVQQPKEAQGRISMELLQRMIEGDEPEEIWMKPDLVIRQSTSPRDRLAKQLMKSVGLSNAPVSRLP